MTKRVIQVFFKAPIEGKVKTRLIPSVGLAKSVIIHTRLCEKVIECVALYAEQENKGQNTQEIEVQFWVDLDSQHTFIQEKAAQYGALVFQQEGADLGQRMQHAMTQALIGADQVVIVGGDCFSLTEHYLAQAFDVLGNNELVLGPADDGGYILIGSKGLERTFFEGVRWGEDSVLASTIKCANKYRKSYELLEERWDIDTWEDIQRHAPQLLD